MDRVKRWLQFAGKGDEKVVAVFGVSPEQCDRAVRYLRRELPGIPVWLFASETPPRDTALLCERVVVADDSMELLVAAQKELWPRWVALSVGTWTGEHGRWPVKLAPLVILPFRALIMNERPDFFPVRPATLAIHATRRLKEGILDAWNRATDINRGLWLLLFAWIAQWSSPLSRYVFQRNLARGTGGQLVPTAVVPTTGAEDSVLVLHYAGRRWDRRAFETQIRNSTARWIRLQQAPENDDLRDLLPLFQDPRTFAVSRQAAFRLWHPMPFPTAAFRPLQPGTASRTLAPVSHSILIDREKLLAVGGIPETIVPGTALYLLFWRAAAAGWLSFSGGGTRALEESADWPYEEAEFVVRVLSDSTLKRLRPQAPGLSRGSISFPIREAAVYTPGRLRVLVVSPYLPYPLSHGGAVRIYNLCRALSEQVDLVLATFREKDDHVHFDKLYEVFREVYVVDIDERKSPDAGLPQPGAGPSSRQHARPHRRDRARAPD